MAWKQYNNITIKNARVFRIALSHLYYIHTALGIILLLWLLLLLFLLLYYYYYETQYYNIIAARRITSPPVTHRSLTLSLSIRSLWCTAWHKCSGKCVRYARLFADDDLPAGAHVLARLRGALVLSGLQPDNCLSGLQGLFGEVSFGLVRRFGSQVRSGPFRVLVRLYIFIYIHIHYCFGTQCRDHTGRAKWNPKISLLKLILQSRLWINKNYCLQDYYYYYYYYFYT